MNQAVSDFMQAVTGVPVPAAARNVVLVTFVNELYENFVEGPTGSQERPRDQERRIRTVQEHRLWSHVTTAAGLYLNGNESVRFEIELNAQLHASPYMRARVPN